MEEKKKMYVPYTKGNEEKKEPIPQKVALTTNPFPLGVVASAVIQLEEQGWTVRNILFAGFAVTSALAIQQQQQVPAYALIITKMFNEGEEIVEPFIMLAEQKK